MQPILSFAIPTYNRAALLEDTLGNIMEEIGSLPVEIVLSDNCSTDHTPQILDKWHKKYPDRVRYVRQEKNYGPDRNYLQAVKAARGTYCCLFGDDDQLVKGALKLILSQIQPCDIWICNRINCDSQMRILGPYNWWSIGQDFTCDFSQSNHFKSYLHASQRLGALFSFISCMIFRKSLWEEQVLDESYIGSGYVHVSYLMQMIGKGCRLKAVQNPLVLCRCGNDSFFNGSVAARHNIDLAGYTKLARDFLRDPDERSLFCRPLLLESEFVHHHSAMKKFCRIKQQSCPQDWKKFYSHLMPLIDAKWELFLVNRLPLKICQTMATLSAFFKKPFYKKRRARLLQKGAKMAALLKN